VPLGNLRFPPFFDRLVDLGCTCLVYDFQALDAMWVLVWDPNQLANREVT
jgi:hypothetical protein